MLVVPQHGGGRGKIKRNRCRPVHRCQQGGASINRIVGWGVVVDTSDSARENLVIEISKFTAERETEDAFSILGETISRGRGQGGLLKAKWVKVLLF